MARRVEKASSSLTIPEFEVDVLGSEVITKSRISRECGKIAVFVDFSGSDPGCNFCGMINYYLWAKIISMMKGKVRN